MGKEKFLLVKYKFGKMKLLFKNCILYCWLSDFLVLIEIKKFKLVGLFEKGICGLNGIW